MAGNQVINAIGILSSIFSATVSQTTFKKNIQFNSLKAKKAPCMFFDTKMLPIALIENHRSRGMTILK